MLSIQSSPGCWIATLCLVLASCSPVSVPATTSTSRLGTAPTVDQTTLPPLPSSTSLVTTTTGPGTTALETPSGMVEIVEDRFLLGGEVTNLGSTAEGLLINSRMVQAVIDIEDQFGPFVYPDTGVWDPERNTTELIASLPVYASYGLNAITMNLQGGNPLDAPVQNRPAWRISAYGPDGSLDPAWMDRLDRVLRAADAEGMAVIVGLFYFGQDHHLTAETAVTNAVDNVVDWIMEGDHRNVLIEICNECNVHYDHEILKPPRVTELMERVSTRTEGRIPVSISLSGGNVPGPRVIDASTYVLLHGNRQDSEQVANMVRELRSRSAFVDEPKPIVFNEDSTRIANLVAAVSEGAGWGYHDKGSNDYHNGFQAPPVNWSVETDEKRAFFEEVARLTSP